MSTRDRLTVAAALAVALASAALAPVYADLGWLLRVLGAVVAVAAAAAVARLVGVPRALQPLAGALGLGLYVCLVFARSTLTLGVVPGAETLPALGALLGEGLLDVEELAPPVPTTPGLVLLAVLGAGAVAVVVDTIAVVLRKVAVAGLPLLVLFAVPSAVLPGGLGTLPFVLGAAGWLGLLLADSSDRVSRWGTPLRSAAAYGDPSLGRVGRRIGAAALGVAVVVPVLVPGLDGRLLGGSGSGDGFGGSRTTTTYNPILSLSGQLTLPSPRTLLEYSTDAEADYLRLTTLDVFDERGGWSSSELSGDIDDDRVQDGVPDPVGRTALTTPVQVEVALAGNLDGPWLPAPAVPDDVRIDGPWLWDEEAETVFSTRTSVRDVDEPYVVQASRVQPTVEQLRQTQTTVPAEVRETYAVPPQLTPFVAQELDRVTGGADTAYDKVVALQAYFRDTSVFTYSDQAPGFGTNARDALENFLRGREGFCEQYASAMAALVRALGLPARVAVGFTTGQRLDDDTYRVTTNEAHAWPEVWFQGAGWVRFEPTPRAGQVDTPPYSEPPTESAPEPTASAAPTAAPAAPEVDPSTGPGAVDRAAEDGAALDGASGGSGPSPWLLLVPGALLVLAAPSLLAGLRRRRRWAVPGPLVAWDAVRDDAVDVGHRWRPADSPRAAAAHLLAGRHLPDDAAAALDRLAAGAERARYARSADADDAARLRQDVGAVRDALLSSVSGRDRWRARLASPSTLAWAAATVGGRTADALDRVDALVTAVGSRLRPRRLRRAG